MKKMNTKAFFNWRKAGTTGLLAAGLALFSLGSSYGQMLVSADFTGQTLPTGWSNIDNGTSGQIWQFNNPYPRSITGGTPGFDADFAILDSDNYGSGGDQDASLETGAFNASTATGTIFLSFDQQFRNCCGGEAEVDVWNGTTWTNVLDLTSSDGYPNPANHKVIDITSACAGSSAAKVRFHYTGSWAYWWAIDNVKIENITCGNPGNLTASDITSSSATVSWSASSIGTPTNGYQYYYSTSSTAPTASTTASGSSLTATANLSSLLPNTQYYVWARSICSSTDTSDWSNRISFHTNQIMATIPYLDTFSTAIDWTFLDNNQTNKWAIGNATGNTGHSMYVSNDGGTSNAYSTGSSSVSQTYRQIVLPAGVHPFNLNFDWKCKGEGTSYQYDYFRVWVVPNSYMPTPGTEIDASASDGMQFGDNFNDPNGSGNWHSEHYVIPSTFAGDTVKLVFEWQNDGGGGTQPPAAIDNVNVSLITCITPDNLEASNIVTNAATVAWSTPLLPANGFQYYYNTTGIAPTANTTATGSSTDTFVNLTGLTTNTLYHFWVRAVCSSTDTSDWSSVLTFRTPQVPATLPYADNFTSTGGNWTMLGDNQTNQWAAGSATGNTGNSMYVSNDDGTSNAYSTSSTSVSQTYRDIVLPAGPNPFDLFFDWKCKGEGTSPYFYDYFRVWVVPNTFEPTAGTQISAFSSNGQQFGGNFNEPNGTGSWHTEHYVIPNTYAGDTVRLVFEWRNDGGGGTQPPAAIDNVDVSIITCITPDSLKVDNITTTTADINWATPAITPGTGYDYYYNTTGTAPTAGTTVSGSATDTFASLSGLTQNTTYYVWVRSVCSSSDKSYWSMTPTIFTTECNTANVPYTVPMATATPPGLPDCMSDEALNPNDNEGWYASSGYPGSSYGFSGNYLESDYTGYYDGPVNNWVYTNKINMNAGTNYKLSFKYGHNDAYTTEKLAVAYGRAATADSMSAPVFDDTSIALNGSADTIVYFTVPVSGAYYIGFHAHSDADQYYLFLSNIVVDSLPTCQVANSLIANNITTHSANVAWFGTALEYRVEYGEAGFTLGTGTQVSSTSGTYQLTGLNPNTTYDFYVRDVCVPGIDSADWSAVNTFTTLCDTPAVALGHDTAFCTGGTIVLHTGNSDIGRTVLWSDGSSADSLSVNTTGAYYVTVTNQFGCSATDTAHINVKTYPVINLGNDTTICSGNVLTLDAGTQPFGTTFYWNTTQTTQTILASDSGKYKVTANNHGCISSDSIQVSEVAAPHLSGVTITQNADGSYSCSASGVQNATGYNWDFGDGSAGSTSTSPTHTYAHTGNYTVTLVISNACGSDSASANIRFIAAGIHQVNLDKDQLKLYPNPARDRVTLKNESPYKMESVSVYNILGQEVFQDKTNNQSEYELNVQGFASGMYNIKIIFKDGNWISRKFEIRK